MKIALIVPSNLYFAPYVDIYVHFLNKMNLSFTILYWDREGIDEIGGIGFKTRKDFDRNKFSKILAFLRFGKFVKAHILSGEYDKVIVFTSQMSIFLKSTLTKNFHKKYIIDFRDLSIEQKLKNIFTKLVTNSGLNIVSSPGFVEYLPLAKYYVSHNVTFESLKVIRGSNPPFKNKKIRVSTIGAIRDYFENREVIDALGNNDSFILEFNGKGPAVNQLKLVVESKIYSNVIFTGFYEKEEESSYYLNCDFVNIYYPDIKTHKSALSNRFYNAILHRRPMIVSERGIQAKFVEEYGLGIVLNNVDELDVKLLNFKNNFDFMLFESNCKKLIEKFKDDFYHFEEQLLDFFLKK